MDDAVTICALCRRALSSETDSIDLDSITICGDCKFLLLEETGTGTGTGTQSQHIFRTNPRTRRTQYNNNSSESIEDMFSHQFAAMINLARHNQTPVSDSSARTTPSGSRRWRRVVSDTESDGFDSIASYGAYDDDDDDDDDDGSDVSVDVHSYLGDDSDSDTDIDPMHAGLNRRWSSDDEWLQVDDGENGTHSNTNTNTLGSLIARVHLQRTMLYNEQSSETEGGIRVRISESRVTPFGNMDNDQETYVGNSGDYLDATSFEELLERLADADNSRHGAPPAAQSFVNNLDHVVVNDSDHNGLVCAVCKDTLTVGTVVNHLPCSHVYHPSCIKPWLSLHNTCPLCRFEFPTDVDYENRKESGNNEPRVQEIQLELEDNVSSEEDRGQEMLNSACGEGTSRKRWWFVAAPVVSLVGIGLAVWLGNPGIIKSSSLRGDRSRRWWGVF